MLINFCILYILIKKAILVYKLASAVSWITRARPNLLHRSRNQEVVAIASRDDGFHFEYKDLVKFQSTGFGWTPTRLSNEAGCWSYRDKYPSIGPRETCISCALSSPPVSLGYATHRVRVSSFNLAPHKLIILLPHSTYAPAHDLSVRKSNELVSLLWNSPLTSFREAWLD